ncbi:MAG TPA: hypothetical protein VF101_12810 [Gaiellaceae bacterium]
MSRMPDDRNGRLGPDASESEDDRTEQDIDWADELEPGEVVEAEIGRFVRHPRAETARLKQVAADGEHGSSPFIEIALVARWIVPPVLIVVCITLLVYFKA